MTFKKYVIKEDYFIFILDQHMSSYGNKCFISSAKLPIIFAADVNWLTDNF